MALDDNLYPDVVNALNTSPEANVANYRFSGYHLPKIQLDETGPAFAVPGIHPYYFNQPTFWEKGFTRFDTMVCRGQPSNGFIDNVPPEALPPTSAAAPAATGSLMLSAPPVFSLTPSTKPKLFKMKPLER